MVHRQIPKGNGGVAQHEVLESRLALAVDVAFQSPTGGAEDWITVVANQGSDVFMQMAATPTRDLFIADNASFTGRQVIPGVDAAIDSIYVFNGQVVERTVDYAIGTRFGVPEDYPFEDGTQGSLMFLLPSEGVDWSEQVSGVIDLNDGSNNELIYFENGGYTDGSEDKVLQITKGPGVGGNLVVSQSSYGGDASPQLALTFDDNTLFGANVGAFGADAVPTLNLTYDTDLEIRTDADPNQTIITASGIGAAVNGSPFIEIFDPLMHQYVPGTLSGQLDIVLDAAPARLDFQVDAPDPSLTNVPISFGGDRADSGSFGSFSYYNATGVKTSQEITVEASLNTKTGLMSLGFSVNGTTGRPFSPFTPEVRLALVDTDAANNAADPTGLLYDPAPNDFTLFPGHTFSRSLSVELPNEGSSVGIESPLVTAGGTNTISLSASDVNLNAPVRAASAFRVPSGENSAFGTITELVSVNAALASPSFDIRMADDPSTTAFQRSRFIVSQTGSISNLGDVLNRAPDTLPSADQIFVEVIDGDIFIEGRVVAVDQSFLISSPQLTEDPASQLGAYPDFEPYQFTTKSRLTGVDVGSIDATTLAITLANDTLVFPAMPPQGPFYGSTAFSELDITTNTSRLRVQASDRVGDSLEQPFPYVLTVRETNDLILDAVAASSREIDISATGSIDMLAAVQSAADVSLSSVEPLVLSAPLTTRFGKIEVTAPSIDVRNSVRVLDAIQDEREFDIRLEATNGELRLQDAISAINRVVLEQKGDLGVTGGGRVMADVVEVTAEDDVNIRTSATRVVVRTPGTTSVEEQDFGVFEIRDSPEVTLIANGYDQIVTGEQVGNGASDNTAYTSPALYADVFDTSVLTVSAPNGSVDVLHYGTGMLSIGSKSAIDGGAATVMSAGGSVTIRSTLADMTVYDAPTPVSNARLVRLATTGTLTGDAYIPNSPGVVASRLNGVRITRQNANGDVLAAPAVDSSYRYAAELDGVDVTTLRYGESILVKDGAGGVGARANGIYTIVGIHYPVGDTSYMELDLVRRVDSDTTEELAQKHSVRVTEGDQFAGSVFTADGSEREADGTPVYNGWGPNNAYQFANVFDNSATTTPVVIKPITSRTGYVEAKAVTTQPLLSGSYESLYNPNAGTITGVGFTLPTFDGVTLGVGELVLVRYGAGDQAEPTKINPQSPGLYQVTSVGNGVDSQWQLSRYQGIDNDGDGTLDRFYTGRVAINEGTLRTAITGEMFEIGLRSLGHSGLRYQQWAEYSYDDAANGTEFNSVASYRADLGSDNPSARVTYVVSTGNGTNNSTGSFGRMLTLYQMNSALEERTGEQQEQQLIFSGTVGRINLEQELPHIYRPVAITANIPVTIDGTAIVTTADGGAVRSGSVSSAVGPIRPTELASARRLVRLGSDQPAVGVYGLRFVDTADGASVDGLAFGGFNSGAAISVEGASNVLLQNLRIGQDANGGRLINRNGIEVQGAGVEHTTIRGSTIVNSTRAGIVLGTNTGRVHVVGNTLGAIGQGNAIGIELGTNGDVPAYVGAAATPGTTAVTLTGTIESVDQGADTAVLRAPVNEFSQQVRVGMVLYDEANDIVRTVTGVEMTTVDGVLLYSLTVDNAFPAAVPADARLEVGMELVLQLGHLVESVDDGGNVGHPGQVTRGDTRLVLPATVHEGDIFLGQDVSSLQPGLSTGASITEIATIGNVTTITLSRAITETGTALLLLGIPSGNQLVGNSDGIVIDGDSSRVVNSVITASIFDGIRVENGGVAGLHQLGGALGTQPVEGFPGATQYVTSQENLSVYGNGLAGIRLMESVFSALGAITTMPPFDDAADYAEIDSFLESRLQIRGNYIGYNPVTSSDVGNGQTGIQNVVVDVEGTNDPARMERIRFLLLTDDSLRDDDGTPDNSPTDGRVKARLLANQDTGLDSQMNQYGVGIDPPPPDDPNSGDREVTPPRRPVVRG